MKSNRIAKRQTRLGEVSQLEGQDSDDWPIRPETETIPLVGTANEYVVATTRTEDLPDIKGYGYKSGDGSHNPATLFDLWRLNSEFYDGVLSHEAIPASAGAIVGGAEEYLSKYALVSLSVPRYYTNFKDLGTYHRWSVDGRTHAHRWFLERCVRLANGKGRIEREETELVLCAPGTVVAAGPRGIFLVEMPDIRRTARDLDSLPKPPQEVHHNIGPISIPEENPLLRDGLGRGISLLEDSEYPSVVAYDGLESGHQIIVSSGDSRTLSANDLKLLATHTCDKDELVAQTWSHYAGSETYSISVSESELPGAIGDVVTLTQGKDPRKTPGAPNEDVTGVLAGYRTDLVERDYIAPSSSGVHSLKFQVHPVVITENHEIEKRQITLREIEV